MTTKIYGASDDLIEFEGDVSGEVGAYQSDDNDKGELIFCSDGTVLVVKFGDTGVWRIEVRARGTLFLKKEECIDEDAEINSDVVHFDSGLKWAYTADSWEKVA